MLLEKGHNILTLQHSLHVTKRINSINIKKKKKATQTLTINLQVLASNYWLSVLVVLGTAINQSEQHSTKSTFLMMKQTLHLTQFKREAPK